MSRVTKSELLEENRAMKNIMVQIHNMTAPFINIDINANEPPKNDKALSETGSTTNKRKTATTKNGSKSILRQAEQNANENATKQRPNTIDATEDTTDRLNTSGESGKSNSADDLLDYLRLRKVPTFNVQRPNSPKAQSNRKSSNIASVKVNPLTQKPDIPVVRVVIDRLTPAQIIKASQRHSVSLKRLNNGPNKQERRRTLPYRKAAPTDLKDKSMLDLRKELNY